MLFFNPNSIQQKTESDLWELLEYSLAWLDRDPGRREYYNKTEAQIAACGNNFFAFQSSPYKNKFLTGQCYHIKRIKEHHEIETLGCKEIPRPKIPYIKPLSSRNLAKYIGFNLTDITDHHERFYLQTLLDNMTELRIVRKLVQIFKTMLARGCGNIRRWIDFVKRSKYKLAGLKTFARGLSRDIEAVENGINMRWSNGAVEGHVNRIKTIKRQMYGRASFELLRKKVI